MRLAYNTTSHPRQPTATLILVISNVLSDSHDYTCTHSARLRVANPLHGISPSRSLSVARKSLGRDIYRLFSVRQRKKVPTRGLKNPASPRLLEFFFFLFFFVKFFTPTRIDEVGSGEVRSLKDRRSTNGHNDEKRRRRQSSLLGKWATKLTRFFLHYEARLFLLSVNFTYVYYVVLMAYFTYIVTLSQRFRCHMR